MNKKLSDLRKRWHERANLFKRDVQGRPARDRATDELSVGVLVERMIKELEDACEEEKPCI